MNVHKCTVLCLVVAAFAGCGGGEEDEPRAVTGEASGSSAREAGRRACHGQAPIEVAQRYRAIAQRPGPRRGFAAYVVNPTPEIEESPGYPRLVAALYATTVPASQRRQAAAGCAEELAATSHGG